MNSESKEKRGRGRLFIIQEMDLKLVRQSWKSCWFRLFCVSHSHLLRREVGDKRPALDLVSLPVSPGDKRLNGKRSCYNFFGKHFFINDEYSMFFTSTQLESTVLSSLTTLKIRMCAYANISLAHPPHSTLYHHSLIVHARKNTPTHLSSSNS